MKMKTGCSLEGSQNRFFCSRISVYDLLMKSEILKLIIQVRPKTY